MKIILSSAMAIIIAASSSTTSAGDNTELRYGDDAVMGTVHFSDLIITNAADARTLVERIRVSARQVCRRANPRASLPAIAAVKNQRLCYMETYKQGIALIYLRQGNDIEALAAGMKTSREIVEAK